MKITLIYVDGHKEEKQCDLIFVTATTLILRTGKDQDYEIPLWNLRGWGRQAA